MKKHFFSLNLVVFTFCLTAFFCGQASAENLQAQFQRANGFYQSGKFDEAAQLYEKIIAEAPFVAELYFNLGNTCFRSGKLNEAVYNYERALAINPWYGDARANLEVARSKIEYKIEDHRNLFMRFHELVLQWFPRSALAFLTLFFSLAFLISSWFWLRGQNREEFWLFPRTELLVVVILVGSLLGAKVFYEQHYREAVVLASEAEVRYGPSMDNQSLMKMGGGLKVFIVDEREDWSRVITWNGQTGWMRNSELGRIKA